MAQLALARRQGYGAVHARNAVFAARPAADRRTVASQSQRNQGIDTTMVAHNQISKKTSNCVQIQQVAMQN